MPTTPALSRRERGNAAIEHLGYWIVAVILLAALIAGGATMRTQIGGYVDQAVCTMRTLDPGCDAGSNSAVGGGAEAEGKWVKASDPAAIDFTPDECLLGNSSTRGEGGGTLGIFSGEYGRTATVVEMIDANGERVHMVKINWDLEGGLGTMMGGVDGMVGWGSAVAITRDENNQIISVQIVQIAEGEAGGNVGLDQSESHGAAPEPGQPDDRNAAGVDVGFSAGATDKTVTTIELPVHDGNREIVEGWLSGETSWGDDWMPMTPLDTHGWDPMVESADPMQQLLHTDAMVTRVTTRDSRTVEEIGGSIKWGLKFGASYTHTETEGSVVGAEYAGPPSGGQRPWEAMDACF